MFSWVNQKVQEGLSTVAGTAEPIYGPEAIQTSLQRADKNKPYTEVTSQDLKWEVLEYTSVETQSFYLTTDNGYFGFCQVIYSNVAGMQVQSQFVVKLWHPTEEEHRTWSSIALSNHTFDESKTCFYADDVAVELSEDGGSYTIKSMADSNAVVNITVTRLSPGFKCGPDGKSNYGTDPKAPWGSMRHRFWPRNKVEGSFIIKDKPIDMSGKAIFIHALQGMKPHHAASRWNYASFQGPTLSAVIMEFETPPSYGSTKVAVGGLAKDDGSLGGTIENTVEHIKTTHDEEVNWPQPLEVKFNWRGKTPDGKSIEAEIHKELGERMARLDLMSEVPAFVKKLVAGAAGTRPYIYQFFVPVTLKGTITDSTGNKTDLEEEGTLFHEATFIS